MDEDRWPTDTLATVREHELAPQLRHLGVDEHHWLDLPDIDMDTPLPDTGGETVRATMADVQPDTVLTFGPDGMTGHQAHISVSRWATDAFQQVAPQGARLHYATMTPAYVEEFAPIFEPLESSGPAPRRSPSPAICRSTLRWTRTRSIASSARSPEHQSQIEGIVAAVGADVFRREMANEWFRLAAIKGAGVDEVRRLTAPTHRGGRMVDRPEPVRDLDWDAERARGFVDGAADIWHEVIAGMRDRPVARRITAEQVRKAVAIPVPDAPMADDALLAYLREIAVGLVDVPGPPGFPGLRVGLGHGARVGGGPGGLRPQHERRWMVAVAGGHRDRAPSVPMVRARDVRLGRGGGRRALHRRSRRQPDRAEARPRPAGGLGRPP